MDSEKIEPTDAEPPVTADEGDDVPTRSPDAIQKEIEATRTELAETIDAIADRLSPRRAAHRGAAAVKASVSSAFGGNGNGNGSAPASVLDASPRAASKVDAQARTTAVREIAAKGGGSTYTGASEYSVSRKLRSDRVLLLVGVAAAIAGFIVLRRARS
jgi:hypothetical protein